MGPRDDDIVAHYEAFPDDERITTGLGQRRGLVSRFASLFDGLRP